MNPQKTTIKSTIKKFNKLNTSQQNAVLKVISEMIISKKTKNRG